MTLDSAATSEKFFGAAQQEYKILAEYKMLQSEDIAGIYVIPSFESQFVWFGVIFVREGIYKDGIFRFNISLPEKFPEDSQPPAVIFQSEIFHPSISPYTGTLDISEAFPTWQYRENHIWQLLKYIQYIFKYPKKASNIKNNKQVLNKTAADLLSQNKGEFILKVKDNIKLSLEKLYDAPTTEDKHYIVFEQFDDDVHGPVLEKIKTNTDISTLSSSNSSTGISWVREGEYKPLSKE